MAASGSPVIGKVGEKVKVKAGCDLGQASVEAWQALKLVLTVCVPADTTAVTVPSKCALYSGGEV